MEEKQKILIVDDRKENLVALKHVLGGIGAEIIEATSGNEALATTLEHSFALAILDVQMPGMDGYELAELLRGDPKTTNLPIIFMTAAYGDDIDIFKGYESGAVDYIVKPYNPGVLRSKVNIFMELERTHAELSKKVDALTASEERYRSLVTTIPDIVYRIDTEGRFMYLNDAIHSLGYKKEELLGSHFSKIVFPADVENVSRELVLPRYRGMDTGPDKAPKLFDERRTGERKTMRLEVRLATRRDDKTVPAELYSGGRDIAIVEINSSGVYAGISDGEKTVFLGTVGIIRDITQRKEEEKELSRYRHELEKMVEEQTGKIQHLNAVLQGIRSVNQLIVREKRCDRLIEKVCNSLVSERGFNGAWIVLNDRLVECGEGAQTGFEQASFARLLDRIREGKLPGCCEQALSDGGVIVTKDPNAACGECPLANEYGKYSAMAISLTYRGRQYGCMGVSISPEFADDEQEISLLTETAGDVAFAMNGIEIEKDHKASEKALVESQDRFRAIFQYAPDAYYLHDLKNRITDFNRAAEELSGYKKEEVEGKTFLEKNLLPPDELRKTG